MAQLFGDNNGNSNPLSGFVAALDEKYLDLCTPFAKHQHDIIYPDGQNMKGPPPTQSCAGVLYKIKKWDCSPNTTSSEFNRVCSDPRYQDWLMNWFDANKIYDEFTTSPGKNVNNIGHEAFSILLPVKRY